MISKSRDPRRPFTVIPKNCLFSGTDLNILARRSSGTRPQQFKCLSHYKDWHRQSFECLFSIHDFSEAQANRIWSLDSAITGDEPCSELNTWVHLGPLSYRLLSIV